jgi:hypothetical protein
MHVETDAFGETEIEVALQRTFLRELTPQAFMNLVAKHDRPIVLEYGVYAYPPAIALLRELKQLGAEPWWFDGDRDAAFAAWRDENVLKGRNFTDQKWHEVVGIINANWRLVEQFFGPNRIIRTIEAGPVRLALDEIYAMMGRSST